MMIEREDRNIEALIITAFAWAFAWALYLFLMDRGEDVTSSRSELSITPTARLRRTHVGPSAEPDRYLAKAAADGARGTG
jgi:hypothetical protein